MPMVFNIIYCAAISKLGSIAGLLLQLCIYVIAHVLMEIINCHSLHHFSRIFNLLHIITVSINIKSGRDLYIVRKQLTYTIAVTENTNNIINEKALR